VVVNNDGRRSPAGLSRHAALFDGICATFGLHSAYFQCAMVLQHPRVAEQLCGDWREVENAGAQVVISRRWAGFRWSEVARALDVRLFFGEIGGKLELRRGFQIARAKGYLWWRTL